MRLELQRVGTLCVALLLGGSISLTLFFVMIFLIEPERTINRHMTRPYVVTFVAVEHKNKTKKTPGKSIEMPKTSSNPELFSIRANALQKVTVKKNFVRLPNIDQIHVFSGSRIHIMNLRSGEGQTYSSKDNHNVIFSGVERRYLTSSKENTQVPERSRIIGGGEIDRIGKNCYEVSSAGGSWNSDTGQTAVEVDQGRAMHALSAREVPCNKGNNSFAEDFLKQLKKRGLILAPVSVTN